MRIKFRPHIASNTNNTCQIVAHMQQHKRTACSCRANPTPACNKRRSMRSRHRHCNVFAQRMMVRLLRPHTESSTHNAAQFKQHKRTRCSSRDNTTPFDTFNKRRSTQSHHCHCNVFGQRMRVRLRPHTASNTNNTAQFKQYERTSCLFRAAQHDTRPTYSTNGDQCARIRVRLRLHTASITNNMCQIQAI